MAFFIFFLVGIALLLGFSPDQLALEFGQTWYYTLLHLLTHMFSHANWSHLLGNYLFTFPYAVYLEHKIGWKAFCKAWLLCGLTAAGSQALWDICTGNMNGMIGSSGAASGVVAMACWSARESKLIKWVSRAVITYYLGMQVMWMIAILANPILSMFTPVAFAAHAGGIVAGIAIAASSGDRKSGNDNAEPSNAS